MNKCVSCFAAIAFLLLQSLTVIAAHSTAPSGLMVELLRGEQVDNVADVMPEFCWVVHSGKPNALQTAYRIRVASQPDVLEQDQADLWDSGRVESDHSVSVSYGAEKPLAPGQTAFWQVKIWTNHGEESDWSAVQQFSVIKPDPVYTASRHDLAETEIAPVAIRRKSDDTYLIDFGKAAFGYLRFKLPVQADSISRIRIIEALYGVSGSEVDVTDKIAAAVEAGNTRIRSSNALVDKDPARKTVKRLLITYTVDGKQKKVTVPENTELELSPDKIIVHFGEKGGEEGIDRKPGGTIRYYRVEQRLGSGENDLAVYPPIDGRNTNRGAGAIPIPEKIGVIAPFRYVELENCPVKPDASMIRQVAVHYPFDEGASSFESDNDILNQVWALCKYSMKATSFAGIYVDGDRERIPYEADAYINQLSHYGVDREYSMGRYSHEYLIRNPTWPTEWILFSVLMAGADFEYTGDTDSIAAFYDDLKAKTLLALAREDGLISTHGGRQAKEFLQSIYYKRGTIRDIVDWPHGNLGKGKHGESDGYVFTEINTVVNAFHYRALVLMSRMAEALERPDEAKEFQAASEKVKAAINGKLFDAENGRYVDGEGTDHSSLHANMFPLAFGLVPDEHRQSVLKHINSRGLACSVYGAQFLLESLYEAGDAQAALDLMTSKEVRSWYNMIRVGSTITLEAWDNRYKPNQDWNHAWGAAPGNIIPRYLLGVRPLEPGFGKVLIQPQPGKLRHVKGVVPTVRGPVSVVVKQQGQKFSLGVDIPANMTARIAVPLRSRRAKTVRLGGEKVKTEVKGNYLYVDPVGSGRHVIEVE